jgi:hypothetical protein
MEIPMVDLVEVIVHQVDFQLVVDHPLAVVEAVVVADINCLFLLN